MKLITLIHGQRFINLEGRVHDVVFGFSYFVDGSGPADIPGLDFSSRTFVS